MKRMMTKLAGRPHRVLAFTILLVGSLLFLLSATSCRSHGIDSKWSKAATPYVPPDLARLLVCITAKWNLAKLPHLEIMLREALAYESEVVDVLLVTDDAASLRQTLAALQLPLNMSFYEAKQDPADKEADSKYSMNEYWLAWEHRKAIQADVAKKDYTTVLYMEDDTRMPWPALVSWALDTQLLAPFNFTRCFYRTEFDPKAGQLRLMDYRHGIDVRATTQMVKLDMLKDAPASFSAASRQLAGKVCGQLPGRKAASLPCTLHRHFVAPDNPFQGMWVATRKQLGRFMQQPSWNKHDAMAINTAEFALRKPDDNWGYPERSASIAILGGLVEVPQHRIEAPSSCMVPYLPSTDKQQACLAPLARVDHLRNAYSNWGNVFLRDGLIVDK